MTRRFLVSSAFTFSFAFGLGVAPHHVVAQVSDQMQPDVDNSKYQFAGVINTDSVYVRSGPSENYYPTIKLEKGAGVTVVGIRFDWLKITPPDGSFCYVAKAYVEKRGDGSVGRVTTPLNVRAGSALNAMKTTVLGKLNPGDDVQIVGEEDEYFKIKPPAGTYLYINKQFVDPVKALTPDNGAASATPDNSGTPANGAAPANGVAPTDGGTAAATPAFTGTPDAGGPSAAAGTTAGSAPDPSAAASTQPGVADASTTQPSGGEAAVAAAPTTQSSQQMAESKFDDLEAQYAQASGQPLDAQPVDTLLQGYIDLDKDSSLPNSLHQIVTLRLQTLQIRQQAKTELVAAKKAQADQAQRQLAMSAEKDELEQRIQATQIVSYAAVGTLQPSSLQVGSPTLYRLTDPATGRTVIYVRSDDPKLVSMIGQFIGVRGATTDDAQMGIRFLTPTAFDTVDPAKINTSVMADLIPPSLAPKAASAAGN
jgi:uncharacterized protein YgiM (DUF1202 family)